MGNKMCFNSLTFDKTQEWAQLSILFTNITNLYMNLAESRRPDVNGEHHEIRFKHHSIHGKQIHSINITNRLNYDGVCHVSDQPQGGRYDLKVSPFNSERAHKLSSLAM